MLLTAAAGAGAGGTLGLIVWMAVLFGLMYFLMIRPQKKEQTQKSNMLANLEVGDTVLTTSGFYGVVIDIDDDTIIVEFGSNKNCRIPMKKEAVAASEKPADAQAATEKKDK